MKRYHLLMSFLAIGCCSILFGSGCIKKSEVYPYYYNINYSGCPIVENAVQFNFWNNWEPASTFHWDLGDGTTSSERSPFHTYSGSGSFIVKLTINNDNTHQASTTINVLPQNYGSHYTSLLSGIRHWNGSYDEKKQPPYTPVKYVDSQMSIQVLDHRTVTFMGTTLYIALIDTVSRKVLIYDDCSYSTNFTVPLSGPILYYYYDRDSLVFIDLTLISSHGDYSGLNIHTP